MYFRFMEVGISVVRDSWTSTVKLHGVFPSWSTTVGIFSHKRTKFWGPEIAVKTFKKNMKKITWIIGRGGVFEHFLNLDLN